MTPSVAPEPRPNKSRARIKTKSDVLSELANRADGNLASNTASSEAEHRHAIIAEAAYLRAEQRHFEPGHDVEDWLAAESALDRQRPSINVAAPSS